MLHVIGLGLSDAKDITVKGLEIVRKCDRVYLESYTSVLSAKLEDLEEFYGRPILEADRELVENDEDEILPKNEKENVAFLVIGDPFGATTHSDLILRARRNNIKVNIVHNASILTAVGCCGLQLYRFGETVSIPYWSDGWQPSSFYQKIISNRHKNIHTLCLLDIKVKEPTLESIMRKKKEYMPPRFMTTSEAATQILKIYKEKTEVPLEDKLVFSETSIVVGLARVGSADQHIVACSLREMASLNLGPPPHCMIIPAISFHPLELEFLSQHALNGTLCE
ncbi:PREDICTED: diphthine methyl ester synthase [Dufourea novaeangliae]|uniref:diphthine methyl ester synthase n=1 Tax=Dufourea novaeangliae TaxID=178035 RepID=A0A154P3F9_DUFNO|nr:PREDICTED: diphthine methyl ester synthase [Dufourea novaeangliae]KZC06475.1 Diphthine synthase [Dufourea novaeangliae]